METVPRSRSLCPDAPEDLAPLWEVLEPSRPARAASGVRAGVVELRPEHPPPARRSRRTHRRQAGGAAGGRSREPRYKRPLADHAKPCAGVQLLVPGEVAGSHSHTASAIRFVLEGEGAYTAVDGERTAMHPATSSSTPSATFHEHGNPGGEPVMWLDGLDVPIVNLFDASFSAHHEDETQPVARSEGDALARYGANMLPVDYEARGRSSPVFSYPYTRSREALETLRRNGPIDPGTASRCDPSIR